MTSDKSCFLQLLQCHTLLMPQHDIDLCQQSGTTACTCSRKLSSSHYRNGHRILIVTNPLKHPEIDIWEQFFECVLLKEN